MLPSTTHRVPNQTDERINEEIRRKTEKSIAYFMAHPEEIDKRLEELDHEWDIERTLEANAASLIFGSSLLGLIGGRKWFLLNGVVSGFLLQHALQGWCPPIPIFRRLGVRTSREIEIERQALKAVRGDFQKVGEGEKQPSAEELMEVAGR